MYNPERLNIDMARPTKSNIESENLATHVELCAIRYDTLNEKLESLDKRMTSVEEHLVAIRETISQDHQAISKATDKRFLAIGGGILTVLATSLLGLITILLTK